MSEKVSGWAHELGKAICDRLGLNHDTTAREFYTENPQCGVVIVTLTTVTTITEDEYDELCAIATRRELAALKQAKENQ